MNFIEVLPSLLKVIVSAAIFFVWVIRYANIVEEFKQFEYPQWLRDLVGVLKITFAIMLLKNDLIFIQIGSIGIAILMIAALATHLKVGNPFHKMLPALSLLVISSYIFLMI